MNIHIKDRIPRHAGSTLSNYVTIFGEDLLSKDDPMLLFRHSGQKVQIVFVKSRRINLESMGFPLSCQM